MSGKCLKCGADWSSKCVKCRNVFWEETTPEQFNCRHEKNSTLFVAERCIYSGCNLDTLPEQFNDTTDDTVVCHQRG